MSLSMRLGMFVLVFVAWLNSSRLLELLVLALIDIWRCRALLVVYSQESFLKEHREQDGRR